MRILGGLIAAAIVVALVALAGSRLRAKWKDDEELFDGSPRVVVPEQGGTVRVDMLVRLANSRGYTLAAKQPTDEPPGSELVFVRDER
ncbi:hypothetical protein [Yinghuangia seranimata]|uniref:hypothetical protein n=1 Tax=Yinghuangia seranimata TaxID=408067 RepID=UPI00248BE36F|nr:hypothetical protein [Yinghuangia seranimata]MDI2126920.1 hypothetical protein [Yinghuangia seranimata]